MKVLKFLACAGLTVAAWPAAAADLGSAPPMTMPASQGQTMFEVGSNWYIRGDLGVSFDEAPTVSLSSLSTPPPGLIATPYTTSAGTNWSTTNFTGGLGAGYRFNDYLRLDATWDYRTGVGGTRNTALVCPYPRRLESSPRRPACPRATSTIPPNICNGTTKLKQYNNAFLANGYVDLGTYGGFTPYVGGGLGLNMNVATGSFNAYQTSDGQVYAPNLTPAADFRRFGSISRASRSLRSPRSPSASNTGAGRSARPPIHLPGRFRPGSASSSIRARRSTSAIATSTAA